MNTFAQLRDFLGARARRTVPSIRATEVHHIGSVGGGIAVRYHNTDVVIAHADGTFTLNTNGYRTPTTKARINDYSPARVYQRKGEWFVKLDQGGDCAFRDGIQVNAYGWPVRAERERNGRVSISSLTPERIADLVTILTHAQEDGR